MEVGYREFTPQELAEYQKSGGVVLDVRTDEEFAEGHIEGALHIPLHELAERAEELNAYKERGVALYCHLGVRSMHALYFLQERGFTSLGNLTRGIASWEALGYPVVS